MSTLCLLCRHAESLIDTRNSFWYTLKELLQAEGVTAIVIGLAGPRAALVFSGSMLV